MVLVETLLKTFGCEKKDETGWRLEGAQEQSTVRRRQESSGGWGGV